MQFKWDERKRLVNLAKHGLDFRRAVQVFDSPSFIYTSCRQNEARWVTIGEARGHLVAVVWTWRSGAIRVIPMRRARREEERRHRELRGRGTAGDDRAR
jgi:uncharacterized protein